MTASLLNLSSIALPGQAPAGGAVQPGAAAGFDALLAAFFGEGQAVDPALAGLLGAQVQAAQPGVAADAAESEDSVEVVEGEAAPADPDAALALIAALAAPVTAAATAALTQAAPPAAEAAPDAPLAWGQQKSAGVPAAPALENADPHAELAAKAADAIVPDASDASAPEPGRSAAAQAPRDAGLGRPAAPVLTPSAPTPPATQQAPVAAAPEAPQQPQAAQPAATAAAAALASEAAEVAPPPQPAPRERASGKPERTQAADTPTARTEAFAAARGTAPASRVGGAEAFAADAPEGRAAGVETDALEAAAVEPDAPADAPDAAGPTQTASTASTAQAAPPPAHTPVRGSPETVANLAAQILKKLDGRSTRFDVELTPAGMGRVDVRVEIDHMGRVSAAMAFDNPQAAKELQARSGELQKALEQAGFDLSGGMSFDVTGDQGRGRQELADRWADHEAGAGSRGRAFKDALATAGEADTGAASALNLRRGLRAGVDVRI